jgi:hypothetical protein
LQRALPADVFNIEVDCEHVYEVGEAGVLVHNAYGDSAALGNALHGAGVFKPEFLTRNGKSVYEAAHIIPSGNLWKWVKGGDRVELQRIQKLLRDEGLINNAANGFWARPGHLGTHTKDFVEDVVDKFRGVTSKAGAELALEQLRIAIMNGKFV